MKRNSIWLAVIASSAIVALSCDSSPTTGLSSDRRVVSSTPLGTPTDAKLVACPTNDASTVTSLVGPLGGLLSTGGATVSIPAGALLGLETVTLTVPASNYVEIDVSVAGAEHFVFELPVTVTVSYARCTRSNLDDSPLSAWYFDPVTKDPLEQMPSVDNKLLRAVTFTTGHLSGYILAN